MKEIAELEKQITRSSRSKALVQNEAKHKVPVKSVEKVEKNLSKLQTKTKEDASTSKAAKTEFDWSIGLPPEKEQELVGKLASAEWTKVKGKKKRNKKAVKKVEEPTKPPVDQDEKLETLLYQTEYQYNSRKKKKEKRKTEWELSSILESFCITEQPPASMQMDVSGVSESSKVIKKKKKKLKDRRAVKGVKMEGGVEKPKPITKSLQAVLVDENDSIAPANAGKPLTYKEKQNARTQTRWSKKMKDKAERRKNRGFKDDSGDEAKVRGIQTKGIFVGAVNKGTGESKKKLKKVMKKNFSKNQFSELEMRKD